MKKLLLGFLGLGLLSLGLANIREVGDHILLARMSELPGHASQPVFGVNAAVGTSWETVWDEGGIYTFPSSASAMTVSSSDAADDIASTGAGIVFLTLLDSNYEEFTETVTMDGTAGVTTASTDIYRINGCRVVFSGSGETNAGNIYVGTGTITAGKPANVYCMIPAGYGTNRMGVYTVPADEGGFTMTVTGSADAGKFVQIRFGVNVYQTNTWTFGTEYNTQGIPFFISQSVSNPIPAKSDIRIDAKASTGSADVSFGFSLLRIHKSQAPNAAI